MLVYVKGNYELESEENITKYVTVCGHVPCYIMGAEWILNELSTSSYKGRRYLFWHLFCIQVLVQKVLDVEYTIKYVEGGERHFLGVRMDIIPLEGYTNLEAIKLVGLIWRQRHGRDI